MNYKPHQLQKSNESGFYMCENNVNKDKNNYNN
jgi:hypothetical protein